MSLANKEELIFPVDINLSSNELIQDESEEVIDEGQLAVDVLETDEELIILATMAGAVPAEVKIFLHDDLLTIKGKRIFPVNKAAHFHYKECYWGRFSRSIVLPVDVRIDLVRAEYRFGLLTIVLPKASGNMNIPIFVMEE